MTDLDGEIFQHLEYFPFGETWVEEHSNTQRTPYLFTSKELDEEMGLYYFGARCFDPRASVWQSPDPILAEYLQGEINNGVFDPLNLYACSHQRPVVMFDPDGLAGMSNAALNGTICDSACLRAGGSFVLDFVPIFGDAKAYAEAETTGDYIWATVGLLPVVGDVAGKVGKGLGRALRRTCSFHGDKLVETAEGLVPISEIETGDLVWSRNPETGQMGWKRVLAAYSNMYEDTVWITIRDKESGEEQVILSNRIHPFFEQVLMADGPMSVAAPAMELSSEGHLAGDPGGGVFKPANLSLYSYAHQKPVVALDPNGELIWFVAIA